MGSLPQSFYHHTTISNMAFYCFTSSIFLLLTSFNLDTTHACSFSCEPDERTCLDNIWGTVTADCSGFLGCLNMTEPCAGTCSPEYRCCAACQYRCCLEYSCHPCQYLAAWMGSDTWLQYGYQHSCYAIGYRSLSL